MLHVQDYLTSGKSFEDLEREFGIKATYHPDMDDGRVILNYHQIDSWFWKTHPIVCECRSLTLNRHTYGLVAQSFLRFFNLGEVNDPFDWNDFSVMTKEDGSLITFYYYNGEWQIQTKASFAEGEINGITWKNLMYEAILNTLTRPHAWNSGLNKNYIYTFELCSPYNQVVRQYPTPKLYLLTVRDTSRNYREVDPFCLKWISDEIGIPTPEIHSFSSLQESKDYLDRLDDKTFEGLVFRDKDNNRYKLKREDYLLLHRTANNGNVAHPKNLLKFVLEGETDELIAVFPYVEPEVRRIQGKLNQWEIELDNMWFVYQDLERKKFAKQVKDHPFAWVLFKCMDMKDENPCPKSIFRSSPERILKKL
jgi:RNA ligase